MDGYLEAEAFLIVPNGESSTEDIFKPFLSNKPKELSMLKYLLSNHLRIVSAYPSEYLARSPLINPSPQLDSLSSTTSCPYGQGARSRHEHVPKASPKADECTL